MPHDMSEYGLKSVGSDKSCSVPSGPLGRTPEEGKNDWRRSSFGRAQKGQPRSRPFIDRFWARVNPAEPTQTGCWDFLGYRTGRIGHVHIVNEHGQREYVHRVSWRLHRGPIPEGLSVLHACDNACCVNPEHLFLGTIRDNHLDSVRKGRKRAWGLQKLNAAQVLDIRRLMANGADRREIATQFGIAPRTVSGIVHRQSWAHLEAR